MDVLNNSTSSPVGFQILAEVVRVTLEAPAGVAKISGVSGDGVLCGTLFMPFTVIKGGLCEPGQVYLMDHAYVQYHHKRLETHLSI